jgi:hypothetical protein
VVTDTHASKDSVLRIRLWYAIRPVVTDTHASKDSVLLRVIPTRIVMLEKCVLMAHANLHFVKLTLTASSLTTARGDASMDSAEIRLRLT